MKRGKPVHIGEVIAKLQQTTSLGANLEQARIWENWEQIVGVHLARHCRPHNIKDNQLRIAVQSPVWMHKLSYQKWDLLRRINYMAGKELVSDVFFVLEADEDALRALGEADLPG